MNYGHLKKNVHLFINITEGIKPSLSLQFNNPSKYLINLLNFSFKFNQDGEKR